MSRQLLEDIRSKLIEYSGRPEPDFNDKEMSEIQKVISRAVGKKVDMGMSDISYHTGGMDFGGEGQYDIVVGSKSDNGKPPYDISVVDNDSGNEVERKSARDFRGVLSTVTQLAKKHKKGLTSY